jgi:hypothetical protein
MYEYAVTSLISPQNCNLSTATLGDADAKPASGHFPGTIQPALKVV